MLILEKKKLRSIQGRSQEFSLGWALFGLFFFFFFFFVIWGFCCLVILIYLYTYNFFKNEIKGGHSIKSIYIYIYFNLRVGWALHKIHIYIYILI
jgi:hypothetical protein